MREFFTYLVILMTNLVSLTGYVYIIASNCWIHADLNNYQVSNHRAEVQYGLFFGKYIKPPYLNEIFHLKITCLPQKNVCFYSCKSSKYDRQEELKELLEGNPQSAECDSNKMSLKQDNVTSAILKAEKTPNKIFLNFGLWFTTLFFLILGLFGCFLLTCFIYLTLRRVKRRQFVGGKEILNLMSINAFTAVMVTCSGTLFACQYMINIRQNVAIRDTLVGEWNNFSPPNVGIAPCLLGPQVILNTFIACVLYYNFTTFSNERKNNQSTI